MRKLGLLLALVCGSMIATAALADEGWGTLRGKLVLKGAPPEPLKLDLGKDNYCCDAEPKDQSLVLDESQAIANVVIYLRPPRGEKLAVHPDYEKAADKPVELDNKGCAFEPHVVAVRTGQPLVLKNTDPVGHSVKAELGDESFNFMLSAEGDQQLEFEEAQRLPRPISCSIHPFMRGWIVVRDDPYMTISAKDGTFEIKNLPAGEHEIQFWHERPGYLKNCKSDAAELDRRGRVKVSITPGEETDLGTIEVDTALMAVEPAEGEPAKSE